MAIGVSIRSLEQLRELRQRPGSLIANEDLPTRTIRVHKAVCTELREKDFEQKVLENGGESGGWYEVAGADVPGAVRCRKCLRD